MNFKRIFGVTLLALSFGSGVATADPWKDESGKGRESAKEVFKHQEKRREKQEKFFEKQQEHFEKQREKEWKRREEAFERREEQLEDYRENVEERRERAEEWREERGAPFYAPLRPEFYPQRYDGRRGGYFPGDGYGYEDNGYYREPHHSDGYDHNGYENRGYVPSPVPYQSYVQPQRPYYPPRRGDGSTSVYTPFGFYQEYDGPTYGLALKEEDRSGRFSLRFGRSRSSPASQPIGRPSM